MTGRVIILNGVSSAGKTTLARQIQKSAEETWLHIAMDAFIATLPEGREFERDWFPIVELVRGAKRLPCITTERSGAALLEEMRHLVARLAKRGFNVVVDEVADRETIEDYRSKLRSVPSLVVKVDAPLDILNRRERDRGDRIIGLAQEQQARLHKDIDYNLEIETHEQAPEALASKVLSRMGN
ncbi:MAG: AAA family ATPase [Erythrobacter sp.]|uniref:chloramphenicol phosphotransferase CPT family protein n=1 Tax=Erythrobacter sp. TaxID=1042 RepID=UPI0026164FDC|nr:AAA family ATPase [Erythrobacter sp.]MDJ0977365.1 AAA family ATPase [Erythrobacter sp.]